MTGTTLRSGHGHDNRMIEGGCRMQCFPGSRMTGSTVAAGGKVLTDCREDKSTVSIMTAGTCGMRICSTAYQGIIMTVSTAGQTNSYQGCMIRGRFRMERGEVSTVTGGTVTGCITDGNAF